MCTATIDVLICLQHGQVI